MLSHTLIGCSSPEYLSLAYTQPVNSFLCALIGSLSRNICDIPGSHDCTQNCLNMASWLPEGASEAQILEINEKAIPINTKKATKFSLDVFQGRVLFLNFVLCLNFTREGELVMLT